MSVSVEENKSSPRLFLLDEKKWQKFQEALEQPARVIPGLQKLMKEKAPWE